ncbi:hypothetical protein BSP239C_04010 [Brevibacterium sp. 239c]|nr:hypothetical protein BSP239C_04010 [Brevibacterium sp. 239c]
MRLGHRVVFILRAEVGKTHGSITPRAPGQMHRLHEQTRFSYSRMLIGHNARIDDDHEKQPTLLNWRPPTEGFAPRPRSMSSCNTSGRSARRCQASSLPTMPLCRTQARPGGSRCPSSCKYTFVISRATVRPCGGSGDARRLRSTRESVTEVLNACERALFVPRMPPPNRVAPNTSSSSWSNYCREVRIVGLSSFVWWLLLVVAAELAGVGCNGG